MHKPRVSLTHSPCIINGLAEVFIHTVCVCVLGMTMFSVDHPDVSPPEKGHTRISINTSGVILQPHPGPGELHP